ncbi:hypothetical protein SAMD00019534_123990 [Acytostelium subglobosum LB1]|uniref:hypothetical protein n=1 Tax=Acytostelium subglobosum LB1 TaxID=1410327 RepID=UPI000644DAAE|nr:hypothetical protein SAMD00019534_123990 [Acytostelium subglobosum LB1]GAM29223.1 hypothetical protein SAMD00019534_123990 [Acytostelium subglobosum LB1]|eukprot:XP_012747797.1 hypothetical protein SAMD00019534_123990 [Acytostelium subglobosum LB1]
MTTTKTSTTKTTSISLNDVPLVVQKEILGYSWRLRCSLKWKLGLLTVSKSWFAMLCSIEQQTNIATSISVDNSNILDYLPHISNVSCLLAHHNKWNLTLSGEDDIDDDGMLNFEPLIRRAHHLQLYLDDWANYDDLQAIIRHVDRDLGEDDERTVELEVDHVVSCQQLADLVASFEQRQLVSFSIYHLERYNTEYSVANEPDNMVLEVVQCLDTCHAQWLTKIVLDLSLISESGRNKITSTISEFGAETLVSFGLTIDQVGDNGTLFKHLARMSKLQTLYFINEKPTTKSNEQLLSFLLKHNTLTSVDITNQVCPNFVRHLFQKCPRLIKAGINMSNRIEITSTSNDMSKPIINTTLKELQYYDMTKTLENISVTIRPKNLGLDKIDELLETMCQCRSLKRFNIHAELHDPIFLIGLLFGTLEKTGNDWLEEAEFEDTMKPFKPRPSTRPFFDEIIQRDNIIRCRRYLDHIS